MLKLILAQLGISITQDQVEATILQAQQAFNSVGEMKESQDHCEKMLIALCLKQGLSLAEIQAVVK